ncbi:putative serine carboxypeptidase [Aspergillus mulundensis]|uniref:Carboxypeptidase n=1 Tax=Aspergillus mulundensis TaxID=1810919 RepID=A0A3D8Q951_9EURO|nr:hypothetical protein DSM5745_11354 [Aspergillus mulundensis]RDW57974.1 hypothetical protein DSM5745_11354 [Aspergillus mulundensis]
MDHVQPSPRHGTTWLLDNEPCDFDIYDISHDCRTIDHFSLVTQYFSRSDLQMALNVLQPHLQLLIQQLALPVAALQHRHYTHTRPTPTAPVYSILRDLIASHNISLHLYSGEYDMLINHYGAELTLQNMTWNGAQGFSPSINRAFYSDDAAPALSASHARGVSSNGAHKHNNKSPLPEAGNWVSDRGVTYHRFKGAGQCSPPREMFAYMRDVVVAGTV